MAQKLLQNTLRKIMADPVEGFCVELLDDSNLFEWKIYLEGPKDTPYEGGIFQLQMSFPEDFPMSPPELKFLSEFWHPNVYPNGKVCISILHPPGNDEMSGELPEERWLPTQTVPTIILSVMSMLNDPNTSSPANVDASVEWRNDRKNFVEKCKKLITKANSQRPPHIVIPHPDTDPDQRKKQIQKIREMETPFDLYDEGYHDEDDYDDDGDGDDYNQSEEEASDDEPISDIEDEEEEVKPKAKKETQATKETKKEPQDQEMKESEEIDQENRAQTSEPIKLPEEQPYNSTSPTTTTTTTTTTLSNAPDATTTTTTTTTTTSTSTLEPGPSSSGVAPEEPQVRRTQSFDGNETKEEPGDNEGAEEEEVNQESSGNPRKRSQTAVPDRKKKKCNIM